MMERFWGIKSFRWHKWRHRTIQRFGDGAKKFGFGFFDHAIGGDDQRTGVKSVLFDLWNGLGEAVKRRDPLAQGRIGLRAGAYNLYRHDAGERGGAFW